MAIRDLNIGTMKEHKLESHGKAKVMINSFLDIVEKEFGKDDKQGVEAQTWKNREKDWYNAERRFIFAAKDPQTRDKWIKLILETQIKDRIREGIAMMMLTKK